MSRPRVFLVDDHRLFLTGVRAELGDEVEVVGEASEVEAAIEMIGERTPDVVLLDVQLPDIDGFEVAARLRDGAARPAVVLIFTRDRSDYGPRVERCGARGFISKAELSAAAIRSLLGATG